MDDAIAQFTSITGASVTHAEQYLSLSDGNVEQAIELYFEDPSLASSNPAPAPIPEPTISQPPRRGYTEDRHGIITIDSDEDSEDVEEVTMRDAPPAVHNPDTSEDAEIARRLQEEMYGGSGPNLGHDDEDDIRAPMARGRETLVGGPGDFDPTDFNEAEITAAVQDQLRQRERRRRGGGYGIFNQRDIQSSIWQGELGEQPGSSDAVHAQDLLAAATDGQSERTSKSRNLAEMFRPPWEIISRVTSFDEAKDLGRDENKWILVNVQDPSIFDCSVLNRDLWKDKEIQNIIKEHFVFVQFTKDDDKLAAREYMQYYFTAASRDDSNAYPHIAIIDPRTGEQLKIWSGAPIPQKTDFLMQIFEFLDRYSLREDAKNPVAKRKSERRTERDVSRMTEEEMLEMALQESLAPSGKAGDEDPDELTKSVTLDKGKRRAEEEEVAANGDVEAETNTSSAIFAKISSENAHIEPPSDPKTTTRIQFRYSGGRVVRRFSIDDPVRRLYEWLKAEPISGQEGKEFEIMFMGKNLIHELDATIEASGLKNGSVMVEFVE